MKVFDLPDLLQILFGKFCFDVIKIRDTNYPDLSNDFIYLACLELWGLDCHHPRHKNSECLICGIRIVKATPEAP